MSERLKAAFAKHGRSHRAVLWRAGGQALRRTRFSQQLWQDPPIRRCSGKPTLEDAAFELLPGEMSGVLAWGDQYAILYKQGETKPIVQEFDAVRDEMTREIREKKLRVAMSERLDRLLKDSQVDNFLEGTARSGKLCSLLRNSPHRLGCWCTRLESVEPGVARR